MPVWAGNNEGPLRAGLPSPAGRGQARWSGLRVRRTVGTGSFPCCAWVAAGGWRGRLAVAGQPVLGFAGLLRQLRAEAGLTQEELAEAAGLGVRTVSDLERGTHRTAHQDTARRWSLRYRPTGQGVLPERAPVAASGPGRPERAAPAGGRRLRRPGLPSFGPAWAPMPTPGSAFRRSSGQVQVPHRDPRGTSLARTPGAPTVHHLQPGCRSAIWPTRSGA
jgi:DNA-binding XRE family transcriptional regulator